MGSSTTFGNNDGIRIEQTGTTASALYLQASTANGGKTWGLFSTANGNSQGNGHFIIRDISSGDRLFISGTNGYVGIGNTNPANLLDVSGDGHFLTKLHVDDQVIVNGGSPFVPSARVTAYTKTRECYSGYSDDENTWCGIFQSKMVGALGSAGFYSGNQAQSIGLWGQAGFSSNNSHYTRTVGVHGDGYGGPYGFTAGVYGSGYGGNCGATYGVYGDIYQGCGFAGYFD